MISSTLPRIGEWRVGLRGDTRVEVFRDVAMLIACASGDAGGPLGTWEPLELSARDDVALLVDWANELVGRGQVSGSTYADARDIEITPPAGRADPAWHLRAQVRSRRVHTWRSPIKTATYHGARLERRDGRWYATLSFDI